MDFLALHTQPCAPSGGRGCTFRASRSPLRYPKRLKGERPDSPLRLPGVVCVSRFFQRFVFGSSVAICLALVTSFMLGEFGLLGVRAGGQQDGAYRQTDVYRRGAGENSVRLRHRTQHQRRDHRGAARPAGEPGRRLQLPDSGGVQRTTRSVRLAWRRWALPPPNVMAMP